MARALLITDTPDLLPRVKAALTAQLERLPRRTIAAESLAANGAFILVAAHSILESARAWKGVLLSGPYFGRGFHIPAPKRIAAQVASRLVPRLSLPAGIRGEHVSHDPVMAHRYDTDPLVFKNGNVRWFTESGRAQAEALARAGSFKLPLYVVYGAEDPLSRVASGKAFFDAAGSADKTFDERVGLRHEVVNEIEWKAVVATMAEWILRHAGASR